MEERLKILDSFLSEFDRKEIDSTIATQKYFTEPKRVVASYVAGEGEEADKSFVQVNWLLNDGPFDTETALAVGFLDNLLLGSPAAPLRMALEESGLGEAIVGYGLEDELRQPTFAIGLKGVAKEDIPKVESLITETIAKIAEEEFTQAAIDSSVNSIEFAMRENNTGRFPRGLSLMLRLALRVVVRGRSRGDSQVRGAFGQAQGEDGQGRCLHAAHQEDAHRQHPQGDHRAQPRQGAR